MMVAAERNRQERKREAERGGRERGGRGRGSGVGAWRRVREEGAGEGK